MGGPSFFRNRAHLNWWFSSWFLFVPSKKGCPPENITPIIKPLRISCQVPTQVLDIRGKPTWPWVETWLLEPLDWSPVNSCERHEQGMGTVEYCWWCQGWWARNHNCPNLAEGFPVAVPICPCSCQCPFHVVRLRQTDTPMLCSEAKSTSWNYKRLAKHAQNLQYHSITCKDCHKCRTKISAICRRQRSKTKWGPYKGRGPL